MGEREGQGAAFERVTKLTGKSITRMRRCRSARCTEGFLETVGTVVLAIILLAGLIAKGYRK
jgi:hypothetical protein